MKFCPHCGNPVSQVIAPDSPTRLVPMATLACVGINAPSCGWTLGFWIELGALKAVSERVLLEPIGLS